MLNHSAVGTGDVDESHDKVPDKVCCARYFRRQATGPKGRKYRGAELRIDGVSVIEWLLIYMLPGS